MSRFHDSLGAFVACALTAVITALVGWYAPRALGWVLLFDLLLGLGYAWLAAGRRREQMERVTSKVRTLPQWRAPAGRTAPAFADLSTALEQAAAGLRGQLSAADDDRRELESVMDSMQDAVVAVDAAGRIQWTNQRMQRLLPVSGAASAAAVRVGHALVQTVRDPDVLECVRLALAERAVQIRRSTSLVPGRIFEVNASPMPGGGAVAVLHDVTRIEEVETAQRDFVANVSHELRTPLTSITGYVETLLDMNEKDSDGRSAQAREFLETILKNATRMNRLTEDLLVMARVERPAADLHLAPVPADALVRDAVRAMSGLVQENEAVLEFGDVTSAQVLRDHDAVMQVLGNLIENAIKYGQQARAERPGAGRAERTRGARTLRFGGVQRAGFRRRYSERTPEPDF